MTETQMKVAARKFAKEWKDRGNEDQDKQTFWNMLLSKVFGVEDTSKYIEYEKRAKPKTGGTKKIDCYIASKKVLIEQKSFGHNLFEVEVQSDGVELDAYGQANRYDSFLPLSEKAKWIITCNFGEFHLYDRDYPNNDPIIIKLEQLENNIDSLRFLIDETVKDIEQGKDVSEKAGDKIGDLYKALRKQYIDPDSPDTLRDLNVLCVRLVFCLYAEDANEFGEKGKFRKYLERFNASQTREALKKLFRVLDQKPEERDPYLKTDDPLLASFPYVNGNLFKEEYEIPTINDEIRDLLLREISHDCNWSKINPTIFGAIFESTLREKARRQGGMHYTMPENIHKVIDPLFLDDLTNELDTILANPVEISRKRGLIKYQNKLANLKFLDPACGSGNFLTETYTSLRHLENKAIEELGRIDANSGKQSKTKYKLEDQTVLGEKGWNPISPIKVSIEQFYGIEIDDFAVAVAKTALWIAESQMLKETTIIVGQDIPFLPLKTNAHIHEANALRLDWEDVVSKNELSYIMGNPPFVGARMMSKEQKDDLLSVFGKGWKNVGNLDYVSGWYKKCVEYIGGTNIRSALVSTNSICQGESVANLWKPLMEAGVHIDFAHRTFRWDSEADSKAHVHCIVVGFSLAPTIKTKLIFDGETVKEANNINSYLVDADNIFVESRNNPLCDVPQIGMGNQPIDNGNYLFTRDEMEEFIKAEPASEKYFKPWYGSEEFINRKPRYCLWLGECSPSELRKMPECMKRVQAVRDYRLSSKRKATKKLADAPTRFQTENMPKGHYIVIPEVSSQRRRYVPMGYIDDSVLCSNKVRLMPEVTLYHFGVLTSNIHMAWMRVVCGRLKSDYDYSIKIVYNNFPWCNPTDEQKAKIEKTAQGILDARALYPNDSLADLYDEAVMPPELRKAHQYNDIAVMQAYGFSSKEMTESGCVAELMRMYRELAEGK